MASKKSWRLNFTDIDLSFSVSTEAGTIKGYTVLRAPKGETEPVYFEKGNAEAIRAYIGLDNADWQDIYEAIEFNKQYGLYLSTPAGTSKSYPSYIGGSYLTTNGVRDFFNVSEKENIDFTSKAKISQLGPDCQVHTIVRSNYAYISTEAASRNNQEHLAFLITGISQSSWSSMSEFAFEYWGSSYGGDGGSTPKGTYYYKIDKDSHKIYVEKDNVAFEDRYCGIWGKDTVNGGYFIVLGGGDWLAEEISEDSDGVLGRSEATSTDENGEPVTSRNEDKSEVRRLLLSLITNSANAILGKAGLTTVTSDYSSDDIGIPFLSLAGLSKYFERAAVPGNNSGASYDWYDVKNALEGVPNFSLKNQSMAIENNGVTTIVEVKAPSIKSDIFFGMLYFKNDTFLSVFQKSPTENVTKVNITGIGYDKWKYNMALPLVIVGDLGNLKASEVSGLKQFVWATKIPDDNESSFSFKIMQVDSDKVGEYANLICSDVTSKYISQDVLITKSLLSSDGTLANWDESCFAKYHIFYVANESKMYLEKENASNYPLRADNAFNTVTLSISEEVYPGKTTNGGTYTGSLNPNGKDASGSNIYWPNVLNERDFSFVEVDPLKEIIVNKYGIYEGARIVDDVLTEDFAGNDVSSNKILTLKGQRYVTHLVEDNKSQGLPGCAWRDEFDQILKAGWGEEAFDDNYDDVFVFFGLTGKPTEVDNLAALVTNTHTLAIALAPFEVTKSTFANPSTMVVSTRHKQLALFAGEFQYYDSYTGKTIYIQPMGNVAAMCARIMDKKMGGWPPAWTNFDDVGGQLSRSVLAAKWRFSDTATKIMDEKGINPIIYNPEYGLMITSSKTTQDPNNLTDWGYLEHTMAFVVCKREIRDNVMIPQIKKPIDDFWIEKRQKQVNAILNKRVSGKQKIWRAYKSDIASANTNETKAEKKFIIPVFVQVSPFSEMVDLTLTNVSQTDTL